MSSFTRMKKTTMRLIGGGGIDGDGAGGPAHARRGKLGIEVAHSGARKEMVMVGNKVQARIRFAG